MFADALKKIINFTFPVVVSKRFQSGKVESGCATFIILNKEGWALTAAHVVQDILIHKQHEKEVAEYNKKIAEINSAHTLTHKQKQKQIGRLVSNPQWITSISHWWGNDKFQIKNFVIDNFADLALGKIDLFDNTGIVNYPVFKNPSEELFAGTSLCRLGFPFHNITATFDDSLNTFALAPNTLPIPRFPIEGIFTREIVMIDENTKKEAKFIETSCPGLRGQSGGPIFDKYGNIWGLQSRTLHFPLGFSPKIKIGSKEIEEHQFINVGIGTHIEEIIRLLMDNNVSFLFLHRKKNEVVNREDNKP